MSAQAGADPTEATKPTKPPRACRRLDSRLNCVRKLRARKTDGEKLATKARKGTNKMSDRARIIDLLNAVQTGEAQDFLINESSFRRLSTKVEHNEDEVVACDGKRRWWEVDRHILW